MNEKILLFIPMYNCELQINRVLSKIKNLGEDRNIFSEILIVDNGSKDNSCNAVKNIINTIGVKVTLVRNKQNVFLGGSHKVAFNYALENNFEYVVVLHGDDQGDINDLIPFIKNGEYKKYDSFLGSRFHKDSRLINYSKFRIFGNKVFNVILSLFMRHRITDMGSGLNMYKTEYLSGKFYLYLPNNLTFNVYMLLYGIYSKSLFAFFPLTWKEEDQVSNAKIISQSLEIISLVIRYIFFSKRLFSLKENQYSIMKYDFDILSQT